MKYLWLLLLLLIIPACSQGKVIQSSNFVAEAQIVGAPMPPEYLCCEEVFDTFGYDNETVALDCCAYSEDQESCNACMNGYTGQSYEDYCGSDCQDEQYKTSFAGYLLIIGFALIPLLGLLLLVNLGFHFGKGKGFLGKKWLIALLIIFCVLLLFGIYVLSFQF